MKKIFLSILLSIALISFSINISLNTISAEQSSVSRQVRLRYFEGIDRLPVNLEAALISKIFNLQGGVLIGQKSFAVSNVIRTDKYAIISLISIDSNNFDPEAVGAVESSRIFYAAKDKDTWLVGLEGTTESDDIIKGFDNNFLSSSAKQILTQDNTRQSQISALYKFPWKNRDSWKWWTRSPSPTWHGGHDSRCINYQKNKKVGKPPYCAIDFGANNVKDKSVLAASSGSVSVICNGTKSVNLRIIDFNGKRVDYYHLKKGTTTATIRDGYIKMGEKLGSVYVGDFKDSCGTASSNSAGHLHMIIPTSGIVMDNWSFLYYYNFAVYKTGIKKNAGNTFMSLI